VCLWRWNR